MLAHVAETLLTQGHALRAVPLAQQGQLFATWFPASHGTKARRHDPILAGLTSHASLSHPSVIAAQECIRFTWKPKHGRRCKEARMAQRHEKDEPILIAGGGIGGLAAAYAFACHGIPVRVLEQAPEFREIGAGIQLGPNIFRALDKIGLKDAVLADAHRPSAMEMRD